VPPSSSQAFASNSPTSNDERRKGFAVLGIDAVAII
jgi:hypothetical protein